MYKAVIQWKKKPERFSPLRRIICPVSYTHLDGIIQAAYSEFLAYGFQKASLYKISEKSGVTTGAIYTRYKNKDALFASLLQDFFETMQVLFTLSLIHICADSGIKTMTDLKGKNIGISAGTTSEQMCIRDRATGSHSCAQTFAALIPFPPTSTLG